MQPSPGFFVVIFDINTISLRHFVCLQPIQVIANRPEALILPPICIESGIVHDPTILQPPNWRRISALATTDISMAVTPICPYVVHDTTRSISELSPTLDDIFAELVFISGTTVPHSTCDLRRLFKPIKELSDWM
jgi:hypothetical protein